MMVTFLVIVLIFGIDFFKRNAAARDPNNSLKISVVDTASTTEPQVSGAETDVSQNENDYHRKNKTIIDINWNHIL